MNNNAWRCASVKMRLSSQDMQALAEVIVKQFPLSHKSHFLLYTLCLCVMVLPSVGNATWVSLGNTWTLRRAATCGQWRRMWGRLGVCGWLQFDLEFLLPKAWCTLQDILDPISCRQIILGLGNYLLHASTATACVVPMLSSQSASSRRGSDLFKHVWFAW